LQGPFVVQNRLDHESAEAGKGALHARWERVAHNPQIRRIRLTIEIPAYKAIDVDRSEEIEVVREQAAP
jgi:hypothetical protein